MTVHSDPSTLIDHGAHCIAINFSVFPQEARTPGLQLCYVIDVVISGWKCVGSAPSAGEASREFRRPDPRRTSGSRASCARPSAPSPRGCAPRVRRKDVRRPCASTGRIQSAFCGVARKKRSQSLHERTIETADNCMTTTPSCPRACDFQLQKSTIYGL